MAQIKRQNDPTRLNFMAGDFFASGAMKVHSGGCLRTLIL